MRRTASPACAVLGRRIDNLRLCLIAILVLAGLTTACERPPQPFAPEHKAAPTDRHLVLSPRLGLTVQPVDGIADDTARSTLRDHLVEALWRHDFTAGSAQGHRGSALLSGRLADAGSIVWRIQAADGSLHVESRQNLDPSWGRLEQYDASQLQALAEQAAELLDQAVLEQEDDNSRRVRLTPLGIGPIDGAPGNGRQSLRAEISRAMREAGVPTANVDDDEALMLIGSVHVGRSAGAQNEVEIIWQVIRPDGTEMGRISQRNLVPRSQLEGAWGHLARNIAEAATDGIVDLLRRIGRESSS